MLTMLFPYMLLLLMAPKWNYSILYLTTIIFPSLIWVFSNFLPLTLNAFMSMDYLSCMLIILTLWISPMIISASQNIMMKKARPNQFVFFMTTLTMILLLSFSVSHLLSFYIMFEASLIPTLLIIMKWGYQPERLQASMYLMLYTITASLPLLAGINFYSIQLHSHHMFFSYNMFPYYSTLMWLVMNLAFMVKLPLFLFHLWLPKAHVEAPVAGSMILAAILLKLGGYGILRMTYMIPPVSPPFKLYILSLALWGGAITSLICVRQQDMKSLIAYSSVGHMSLVMGGALTNSQWGLWGAISMMIAHGLLSSALFASADMMYNMSNSRSMLMNKGLNIMAPSMSMLWFIMCAANMAAPPSLNLFAEIMLITSATMATKIMILPLSVMSFTAAAYSLTLYISLNHGPLSLLGASSAVIIPRNIMIILTHVTPISLVMISPSLATLW